MLQSRVFGVIWLVFMITFFIFDDSYLGLLLLILTSVISVLLVLNMTFTKNKLIFDIETKGTVHKNEPGKLTIQVRNKSLLPISKVEFTLEFENKLTHELETKQIAFSLNSKGIESINLAISSKYCGKVHISIKDIRFYDFLGIFTRLIDQHSQSELFILPEVYPIKFSIDEINAGFANSETNAINRRGTDGLEVFGIKEYSPEDDLKHVHWKLTSKFDELIVKEMTEAVNYTFLILIDFNLKKSGDKNDPAIIDAMIDTFISTSEALLAKGYEHSIGWLNKEADVIQVENVSSTDQLTFLLKQILLLEQTENKMSLLEYFTDSTLQEYFSHLIYLTSEKGHETTSKKFVQTEIIERACYLNQNHHANDFIYTPETMTEDLYELSI